MRWWVVLVNCWTIGVSTWGLWMDYKHRKLLKSPQSIVLMGEAWGQTRLSAIRHYRLVFGGLAAIASTLLLLEYLH